MPNLVKIVRIVPNWDMRKKHALRLGRVANKLRHGEVLVAFNLTRKMARIIDSVGAVHDYYAEAGQFSIDMLKKECKAGLSLELTIGRNEKRRVTRLGLAA